MDFDKKEFYGIVAKAKKQMQITIDQDCNVADTKPDVEKMIQTRGIVKIQETEMMVDRVRIKGEFVFQGLYGTNDTSAYLESLEYSLPFEEYVHIEGVLPSDYVKVKYTIDDINTILINSRKISIRVLLTFSFQITEEMKEKGIIEIHEENVSVLKKDVQITDLIVNKKDIARLKEELVEGDALPSIRAFANDLKVSVLTIRRVYEELEQEGFIVSQVGIGTFVSTSNLELLRDSKRRLVEQKMADMIQTAKSLKISKEELNSMMDILYEED